MTITYTIPGATLLDQLSPTTLDGLPNNDANDDCVPTSIAEGLHILTGQAFDGDELKDAVYGQTYVGFQSAARYIAYCADHGVTLAAHNGSQSDLIAEIHTQVSAGHPVIVTMPSQWDTAPADPVHPSGYTHVGIAVGVGPGMIRVMNPWHGFYQDESDTWWQARLCYGQVWPMVKNSGAGASTGASTGGTGGTIPMWHQVSPGVMADTHNVETRYALATYLAAHPDTPDVVPGCTGETYITADTSVLPLAGAPGALVYRKADNAVHTDQAGFVLWQQHQALVAAQAAEAQAQQHVSAADAQAQHDAAIIGSQSSQIATLTQQTHDQVAQIATLKAQLASASAAPSPTPAGAAPAPTTPADAAALLVQLIYAEAEAALKAVSTPPATPATPPAAG